MIVGYLKLGSKDAPGRVPEWWKKQDLAACNMVNRAWHGVVQPHLFSDLTVSFCGEGDTVGYRFVLDPFVNVSTYGQPGRERRSYRGLRMFLHFLANSPSVARDVKRLRLRGPVSHYQTDKVPESLRVSSHTLLSVLRALPHLKILYLSNVALRSPVQDEPKLLTPLKSLRISYNTKKDVWHVPDLEITQLLGCFAKVNELHLIGCGKRQDSGDLRTYTGPSELQFESLVMQRRINAGELYPHLKDSSCGKVRRLVLRNMNLLEQVDYESFKDFFHTIGSQVEQLRIYLQHYHVRGASGCSSFFSLRPVSY